MALPKQNRLKNKKDFEAVFKKGKAISGTFLFAKFKKSSATRLGFVVSSKVAKQAVIRNKIRRILSESARSRLVQLQGYDSVIIVTRKPEDLTLLSGDLLQVFSKLNYKNGNQ